MFVMNIAASDCKCSLHLPKVLSSARVFYSFVKKMLCSNDLKFWLVCEGAFRFGEKSMQLLCRAIYYDFLGHTAPLKHQLKQTQPKN